MLRRVLAYLQRASRDEELVIDLVDPARGLLDLADGPGDGRLRRERGRRRETGHRPGRRAAAQGPAGERGRGRTAAGRWWSGPRHVLVVDDYDLLVGPMGGPFGALADLLAQGGDIGLGVVLTRRVAGSQRTAFEPFGQRLREVAGHILILSGSPDEGPLAGGVTARSWPPGRGMLVTGRARPQLLQCCLPDEESPGPSGPAPPPPAPSLPTQPPPTQPPPTPVTVPPPSGRPHDPPIPQPAPAAPAHRPAPATPRRAPKSRSRLPHGPWMCVWC